MHAKHAFPLVIAALSCGCASGTPQEREAVKQQAEQVAKSAEQVAKGLEGAANDGKPNADEVAKGFQDLAKGLGQLASAGQTPVDPVSFRTLYDYFPEVSGWEKGRPTGERLNSPVSYSEAKVTYRKGDSEIDASIIDSGFNRMLMAPYAMFLTAGFEKETEDGYEKSLKVEGFPAWEKWDKDGGQGELNALVGERFLVRFEGSKLPDTAVLHQLAGAAGLTKLAGQK
ncbi:MAG: hypothetical protein U0Q12_06080 [Vicinamibacterales bacterium]